MKIKILEYHRYKNGIVKVQSHSKNKGKWKINHKFEFHKMLISNVVQYPIIYQKEYSVER
jgi:hypothetical protein